MSIATTLQPLAFPICVAIWPIDIVRRLVGQEAVSHTQSSSTNYCEPIALFQFRAINSMECSYTSAKDRGRRFYVYCVWEVDAVRVVNYCILREKAICSEALE